MLLINQGIQQDDKPIEENNVLLKIIGLKLSTTLANTLDITFKILTGKNKNKNVYSNVCFDGTSVFSWKYRALRKCAGCPYKEGEKQNIDIEELLLNKVVCADLKSRKYTNKDKEEKTVQDVQYKKLVENIKVNVTEELQKDTPVSFDEGTSEKIKSKEKAVKQQVAETTTEKPSTTNPYPTSNEETSDEYEITSDEDWE